MQGTVGVHRLREFLSELVTNVGIPTTPPLQAFGLEATYLQFLPPSSHGVLFYVFVFSPLL